jgi:integrase
MRKIEKIRRKDGKRAWQLRYHDAHGRLRCKRFKTEKEGEEFRDKVRSDLKAGVDPGRNVLFTELVAEWSTARIGSDTDLRAATVKDYRESLARLSEEFGQREIRGISSQDLVRLGQRTLTRVRDKNIAQLDRTLARIRGKAEGKRTERERDVLTREPELRAKAASGGARAAAKIVATAKSLWAHALDEGYLVRNRLANVKRKAPKGSGKNVAAVVREADILTPQQIGPLLAATPPKHRCAVWFLFESGVRFGELRGLKWSDFEWADSRVFIQRQLSGLTGEEAPPKTDAGVRHIDLPADLILALKKHQLAQPPGEQFVFPLDPRNFRERVWYPAFRRAGLRPISPHHARHTFASHLIAAGADVVEVAAMLGHADPGVTLKIYSHAFARRRKDSTARARLTEFRRAETAEQQEKAGGCLLVVSGGSAGVTGQAPNTEVTEAAEKLMVARGGIEPPTRGFSIL